MGAILADRVTRLGQFRFLALGIAGGFVVGAVLADIWPPKLDPSLATSPDTAAATVGLWLVDLVVPVWFVLFYIRRFFLFNPRGEVRLGPTPPISMRQGELERDADLRALGFAGLGQFEAHIVGRSWHQYWVYSNANGSVTATIARSGYRCIVCFSTYWTNGFNLCAFHGARRLAVLPASADRRVVLVSGTLREAYEQYSAEVARVEFPTPASFVLTTSLGQVMAHEIDDFKTLPTTAALLRRSPASFVMGTVAAIVLIFGLAQTVAYLPWR